MEQASKKAEAVKETKEALKEAQRTESVDKVGHKSQDRKLNKVKAADQKAKKAEGAAIKDASKAEAAKHQAEQKVVKLEAAVKAAENEKETIEHQVGHAKATTDKKSASSEEKNLNK